MLGREQFTGDERERAKEIANQWSPVKEHQLLLEGHETNEFWKILGGKEPYASDERLSNPEMAYPARLFHCSNASGYFKGKSGELVSPHKTYSTATEFWFYIQPKKSSTSVNVTSFLMT